VIQHIAIIGVGLLGSAVASRLLAGGFAVTGYDSRPEQLTALGPRGLRGASSLKEAATGADAVFTILPSLETVEAAILGPGGLLAGLARSATLIQMSTISPTLTRRLGEAAASAEVGFLDAPMSGTSAMVERGDCTIFAGGDASRIEACRPVFAAVAKRTVHVGPIGSASLAKLATNLLVALNTAAVAEALVLGVKGAGEAGAIGSCPAVMNAIVDALWRAYGIRHVDMPATPEKIWAAIAEGRRVHTL